MSNSPALWGIKTKFYETLLEVWNTISDTTGNIYENLQHGIQENKGQEHTEQICNEDTYYNMGPVTDTTNIKIGDFRDYVRTKKEERSYFENEFKVKSHISEKL